MVDLGRDRISLRVVSRSDLYHVLLLLLAATAMALLARFCHFVRRDYQTFQSLGPGGTPKTFRGYLRVSALRLFSLKEPLVPPTCRPGMKSRSNYLLRLPRRLLPRPRVDGIAPHRQLDQKPDTHLHEALRRALNSLANDNMSFLAKGKSCFEKHGLGLFLNPMPTSIRPDGAQQPDQTLIAAHGIIKTCKDTAEICHLHPSDSSMHLTLHPNDAGLVISHGWGERHPLAGQPIPYISFEKVIPYLPIGLPVLKFAPLLPYGFVMVYAPADDSDVGILMEIVRAAGWWVGGVCLGEGGRRGVGVLSAGTEKMLGIEERWNLI